MQSILTFNTITIIYHLVLSTISIPILGVIYMFLAGRLHTLQYLHRFLTRNCKFSNHRLNIYYYWWTYITALYLLPRHFSAFSSNNNPTLHLFKEISRITASACDFQYLTQLPSAIRNFMVTESDRRVIVIYLYLLWNIIFHIAKFIMHF